MVQKLNKFLDSFQETYKELVDSGQINSFDLDKFFGDCSDILVSLLDLVERESSSSSSSSTSTAIVKHTNKDESIDYIVEIINKSLGVAELILHVSGSCSSGIYIYIYIYADNI